MKLGTRCTQSPRMLKSARVGGGQNTLGKAARNGVVMLAQVSDEEKLTEHMKFVREMAAKMGMHHEIYKLAPDSR